MTGATNNAAYTAIGFDERGEETNADGTSYSYDLMGELGEAQGAGVVYSNGAGGFKQYAFGEFYGYGADGRLKFKSNDGFGNETAYLYDGDSLVYRWCNNGSNLNPFPSDLSTTDPTVFYVWGPTGPAMEFDLSGDSKTLLYDPQGSCIMSFGGYALAQTQGFNPVFWDGYGSPVFEKSAYDNYSLSLGGYTQPLQYKGQFGCLTDYASGLDYCIHRYYDPQTGRWLSRDPAGLEGGVNAYEYCGDNPVMGADPSGLVRIVIISYRVFMLGWHRGILVEDNVGHMHPYSFAGGPEGGVLNPGDLVSKSGPWGPGTQDWYRYWHQGGKRPEDERRVMAVIEDGSPMKPWVQKLKGIEREIRRHKPRAYSVLPSDSELSCWPMPLTANSNTYCRYLLEKAGLLPSYDAAIRALGHDLPWAPGWYISEPFDR
ncbi:MAG: RHS repeat-associated core domain-containing protein [Fimbriimonadaceae bacterium]